MVQRGYKQLRKKNDFDYTKKILKLKQEMKIYQENYERILYSVKIKLLELELYVQEHKVESEWQFLIDKQQITRIKANARN